jgi:hypothetical protein
MNNPLRIKIHQAGFRTSHHQRVFGQEEAAGTESIAVQGHAHQVSVGKSQSRGAIPGLNAVGVVTQERRLLLAAGGRKQHSHRFGDAAAVARQQLHNLVQTGRIRAVFGQDGVALRRNGGCPRLHAAAVPPDGIDLPVMRQGAQRLGPVP